MTFIEARVIDATHLELETPLDVPLNRKVMVSVARMDEETNERAQWLAASEDTLRNAYGNSEPDYSLDMLQERNPDFSK